MSEPVAGSSQGSGGQQPADAPAGDVHLAEDGAAADPPAQGVGRKRPPLAFDGKNYTSHQGNGPNTRLYFLLDPNHPLAGVSFSYDTYKARPGKRPTFYLKCSDRNREDKCKGRATIQNGFMMLTKATHTCLLRKSKEEQLAAIAASVARNRMKVRACKEGTKLKIIYNEEIEHEPDNVKKILTYKNVQRCLDYARGKHRPKSPKEIKTLIARFLSNTYSDDYQRLYRGFVSVKIRGHHQYAIIFADEDNFKKVCEKTGDFCLDGTFSVIPGYLDVLTLRSSQVLNLVGDYAGAIVGVATVVMTCRKVRLYQAVFNFIKGFAPYFKPQTIMADWELALRKTAAVTWPQARVLGCWFHFAKALLAKIKGKFGLADLFLPKATAAQKAVKRILMKYLALPLLRPQDMKPEVLDLERELREASAALSAKDRHNVNRFHIYFVTHWCKFVGPYNLSVFNAPYTTNNRLERFNKELAEAAGRHPQFFRFLEALKTHVYAAGATTMLQIDAGTYTIKDSKSLAEKELHDIQLATMEAYRAMRMTAKHVLERASTHFSDGELKKALKELHEVVPTAAERFLREQVQPLQIPQNDSSSDEGDALDISSSDDDVPEAADIPTTGNPDVDEERRAAILDDPDLVEFEDSSDDWMTVNWEEYPDLEVPQAQPGDVNTCGICSAPIAEVVTMQCKDMICTTCFTRRDIKLCPFCRQPKRFKALGRIGTTGIETRSVVLNIISQERQRNAQAQEDATEGRAESSDDDLYEDLNQEAIREALREDGVVDVEAHIAELQRQGGDLGEVGVASRRQPQRQLRPTHRNYRRPATERSVGNAESQQGASGSRQGPPEVVITEDREPLPEPGGHSQAGNLIDRPRLVNRVVNVSVDDDGNPILDLEAHFAEQRRQRGDLGEVGVSARRQPQRELRPNHRNNATDISVGNVGSEPRAAGSRQGPPEVVITEPESVPEGTQESDDEVVGVRPPRRIQVDSSDDEEETLPEPRVDSQAGNLIDPVTYEHFDGPVRVRQRRGRNPRGRPRGSRGNSQRGGRGSTASRPSSQDEEGAGPSGIPASRNARQLLAARRQQERLQNYGFLGD